MKQQRSAAFQQGLPYGHLQRACRKEGKAVAGIQHRLKGPKFRSDIQGEARKAACNSLSLQCFGLKSIIQLCSFRDHPHPPPQQCFMDGRAENCHLQVRPQQHKTTWWRKARPLVSWAQVSAISLRKEKNLPGWVIAFSDFHGMNALWLISPTLKQLSCKFTVI